MIFSSTRSHHPSQNSIKNKKLKQQPCSFLKKLMTKLRKKKMIPFSKTLSKSDLHNIMMLLRFESLISIQAELKSSTIQVEIPVGDSPIIVDGVQSINLKETNNFAWLQNSHTLRIFQKWNNVRNYKNLGFGLSLSQKSASKRSSFNFKKLSFKSSSNEDNQSQSSNSSNRMEEIQQLKTIWSRNQNLLIISLFKQLGPDWVEISSRLQNKPPKETKKHFLKLIRQMICSINNTLRQKKKQKQFNYKIIKIAIEETQNQLSLKDNTAFIKDEISKLVFNYLTHDSEAEHYYQDQNIEAITQIFHAIKKNRKKKHSSKASTEIYQKQEIQFEHLQQGYLSDESSFVEQGIMKTEDHNFTKNSKPEFADERMTQYISRSSQVIVEEEEERISDLLRQSGVLEVEERIVSEQNVDHYLSSPRNSSENNLNNEDYQHFFEQGELEGECFWKISSKNIGSAD